MRALFLILSPALFGICLALSSAAFGASLNPGDRAHGLKYCQGAGALYSARPSESEIFSGKLIECEEEPELLLVGRGDIHAVWANHEENNYEFVRAVVYRDEVFALHLSTKPVRSSWGAHEWIFYLDSRFDSSVCSETEREVLLSGLSLGPADAKDAGVAPALTGPIPTGICLKGRSGIDRDQVLAPGVLLEHRPIVRDGKLSNQAVVKFTRAVEYRFVDSFFLVEFAEDGSTFELLAELKDEGGRSVQIFESPNSWEAVDFRFISDEPKLLVFYYRSSRVVSVDFSVPESLQVTELNSGSREGSRIAKAVFPEYRFYKDRIRVDERRRKIHFFTNDYLSVPAGEFYEPAPMLLSLPY